MQAQGFVSDLVWLPEAATSANFPSKFVIDARHRFKPRSKTKKPPRILATLDRAEEACRRLGAGDVKQADLAREWGFQRARISQLVKLWRRLDPAVRAWVREHAVALRISERKLRPILALPPGQQMPALLDALGQRDAKAAG